MSKNMKTCPFCGEEILEAAKKCRHCDEWLVDEKPSKEIRIVKRQWPRITIGLIFMFLVVAIGFYENNAGEILLFSQRAERAGKYKTATKGYQVVIEKFWMSFATIDAKEGLLRIKSRTGFSPYKRLGTTSAEIYIHWFNPYIHHGLPLVASLTCGTILLFMFLLNLCFLRFMFFKLILGTVSIGLFIVQLTEYGIIKYAPFDELTHTVMANPSIVFTGCYLLIVTSMIIILIPKKKNIN